MAEPPTREKRPWPAAIVCLVALCLAGGPASVRQAFADAPATCSAVVSRRNLVDCALRSSLLIRAAAQEVEAVAARRVAAQPWLPSNPSLGFAMAHRHGPGAQPNATNWYATLSQEVEVGAQRRWRGRSADRQLAAQRQRLLVAQRDTVATTWNAYFEVLAAAAQVQLAQRLEAIAVGVAKVTRGMSAQGLLSEVDADVSDAAASRIVRERITAERQLAGNRSRLAVLLGLDAAADDLRVEGDLEPLRSVAQLAATQRAEIRNGGTEHDTIRRDPTAQPLPELQALQHDRQALEAQAVGLRRKRIPNLRLHLLAQNDGFNERVLGGGVELPIPLPQPVGRIYKGELAELTAMSQRTETLQQLAQRDLGLRYSLATQAFRSRQQEHATFSDEQLARAYGSLQRMSQEVEAGRLAVRDVLVAQQTLIDLLRSHIEAHRQLCLASVELARAAGLALERGE